MPRHKKSVPAYQHHKPTGQAYVRFTTGGARRVIYLGKYNSPGSRAEYRRVTAELEAAAPAVVVARAASVMSVNEVLLAFMRHAVTYYRAPDGEPTNEVDQLRRAIIPVRELYGHVPVTEFGPKALAAVRQRMVGAGLCRTLVNKRVDRVKRVFKWAASEELVPVTVYQSLRTLTGLRAGRTEARESDPVRPADPDHVAATLPHLNRHVRAMVELQQLTGMRPGEVCRLAPGEVDRGGPVWLFTPRLHKTRHRGKVRVVPIGPRAQAVLEPFLAGDPAAPTFSPRAVRAERYAALRAARKSKVPPSQRDRRVKDPKRPPASAYTPESYAHAVGYAARKAGVPHWHPNMLRHLFATEVRKAHGLEAAQVLLGHTRADVTQVYAERDLALAARVATEVG